MEVFQENILAWLIVLALLCLLIYTAWVIKNEKKTFLDKAKKYRLKHFLFKIPPWWSQTGGDSENSVIFERTDTSYDWKATFLWTDFSEVGKGKEDLREVFVELIQSKGITFDSDTSIIYNPSDFKSHQALNSKRVEVVRVEGTATEVEKESVERIYYDAILIRDFQERGYLFAESKSSVLNGLVEGPYFEQAILNFELG